MDQLVARRDADGAHAPQSRDELRLELIAADAVADGARRAPRVHAACNQSANQLVN